MVQAAPKRTTYRPIKPTPVPAIVLPPAEKAAKAELDKMASLMANSEGIVYTADVSFATKTPAGVSMDHVTTKVTLEKFAKMYIQALSGTTLEGVLNATGSQLTMYDAIANDYLNVTTSEDLESALNALNTAGGYVFPTASLSGTDLHVAFAYPDLYFYNRYDIGEVSQGFTLHYSMVDGVVDGVKVESVTQAISRGGITKSLTYAIDPTDYHPVQFLQAESAGTAAPITVFRVDFTTLKVLKTPLPSSTYSFTPPPNATLVKVQTPPSSETPPTTGPSAPPTTTPATPAAPGP
jgi:outer membrane lipoprotein-sorting protein